MFGQFSENEMRYHHDQYLQEAQNDRKIRQANQVRGEKGKQSEVGLDVRMGKKVWNKKGLYRPENV
jgi:hypothetical protein